MMPSEKDKLLELLDRDTRWCQGVEACDAAGNPVRYDDAAAVAWDLTGALCRLFGWRRACELFTQLDRHLHGRAEPPRWAGRDAAIAAMAALQEHNDRVDMTFRALREQIQTMLVWSGKASD